MKKLIWIAAIAAISTTTVNAQLSLSLNIGTQPAWGPTGYDHADYYYLPDADAYYDVNSKIFVYKQGNRWARGASLPGQYRNMDLYHAHKVVINNDRDPWNHHDRDYKQYHSFAGRRDQEAIRDSKDQKYWQNPGNGHYNDWKKNHGNDHHDDHGHDNGHGHH